MPPSVNAKRRFLERRSQRERERERERASGRQRSRKDDFPGTDQDGAEAEDGDEAEVALSGHTLSASILLSGIERSVPYAEDLRSAQYHHVMSVGRGPHVLVGHGLVVVHLDHTGVLLVAEMGGLYIAIIPLGH